MSDERSKNRNDNRSADEIERDLEGTRERLADDLDDLGQKVSPQNLKSEAKGTMDKAQEAAMDRVEDVANDVTDRTNVAGERIVEGVRENPMPVAIVLGALGAGYALMQARRRGEHRSHEASERRSYETRVKGSPNVQDRAATARGYRYGAGDSMMEENGHEDSFIRKNGLLVGLGALAAGAVVGTIVSTRPETFERGRETFDKTFDKARNRVGEATGKLTERFSGSGDEKGEKDSGIQIRERIRVNKSADELYRFWRDFENLPKVMSHLEKVTTKDGKRSHWVAKGPANTKVEWDAVITDERPNDTIAWRAVSDADVPNEGAVKFRRVGLNSTDIIVSLTYHPPGGKLGEQVAKSFGEEPSQQISDDLEKFKQEVESGKMSLTSSTTTAGTTRTGPTI